MDEDVRRHARQWDRNARSDALWAILSDPSRLDEQWTAEAFFATGQVEWARVEAYLSSLGLATPVAGRFLDFGCGVGRITAQLAQRFASGLGVDISALMIEEARRRAPGAAFIVNEAPDLAFASDGEFDFIYSHMVLQHIGRSLQAAMVKEFLRVLGPGGIAVFQVADGWAPSLRSMWRRGISSTPRPLRTVVKRALGRRPLPRGIELEMHPLPSVAVARIVRHGGGTIAAAPYTNSTDSSHGGQILFLDRAAALRRVQTEPSASPLLSRMYVVTRGARA